MLTGCFPFPQDEDKIIFSIVNARINFDIPQLSHVSANCKNFLASCLAYSPHQRITADQGLGDVWFQSWVPIQDQDPLYRVKYEASSLDQAFNAADGHDPDSIE